MMPLTKPFTHKPVKTTHKKSETKTKLEGVKTPLKFLLHVTSRQAQIKPL